MRLRALSNYQIIDYFKDNPRFGGVFSKDEIFEKGKGGQKLFYILNLDNKNSEGSHWVLLSMLNDNTSVYFDSYGVTPPEKVKDFMKRFRPYSVFNNSILQSLGTESCGYYSIFMVEKLLKGHKFIDVLDQLRHNSETTISRYFERKKLYRV